MGGSDSRFIIPRSYGGLGYAIPAFVAEGFGLKALEVKTPTELDAAMDKAFSSTAPVFLDAITQPEVDLLLPVYIWLAAAEKASAR